ncbi:hypothetical protein ES705_06273 [subsurface metagenome]
MKNMNPKIVEILDERNLKFRCKKCKEIWYPSIKPGSDGRLYRRSWQCPRGCTWNSKSEKVKI